MKRGPKNLVAAATVLVLLGPLGRLHVGAQAADSPAGQTTDAVKGPADRPVSPPARGDVGSLEDESLPKNFSGGQLGGYLKTLLALAAVIGLIFLARLLFRRLGPGGHGAGRSDPVAVVARIPVGPRQQLLLVHMGQRLLLVGASAGGFAALGEASDPDEVADLLAKAGGKTPVRPAGKEDGP